MEDKTIKETPETVKYFKYDQALQNILLAMEIVYALLCMSLFLMIIYWNQQGKFKIITGEDEDYLSDHEVEFDQDYADNVEDERIKKEQIK